MFVLALLFFMFSYNYNHSGVDNNTTPNTVTNGNYILITVNNVSNFNFALSYNNITYTSYHSNYNIYSLYITQNVNIKIDNITGYKGIVDNTFYENITHLYNITVTFIPLVYIVTFINNNNETIVFSINNNSYSIAKDNSINVSMRYGSYLIIIITNGIIINSPLNIFVDKNQNYSFVFTENPYNNYFNYNTYLIILSFIIALFSILIYFRRRNKYEF